MTSRWVTIAGRVEHGVKIFGYLQLGGQVFAIPLSLAQELAAIPDNLSPGERAARRAMAFLRAMRGGLESLGTAHQMLSEHVQVTEAAPPDPPAERTGEPSARTGAGAGGPESRTPEARASANDVNPVARARAVELLERRVGDAEAASRRVPAGPVTEAVAARPRSAEEALALYNRVVHGSGGNEVGLFYNPNTGEFAVRVGSEFSVSPPAGEGWQAIIHLHPNPENVIIRRMPAPADVLGAVHAAMRTGSHTEFVQFVRPDGTTGVSRVEVTAHPLRIVVELPAEPASRGHPGEPARRVDVTSVEAYAQKYGGDTTGLDPSSALYRWIQARPRRLLRGSPRGPRTRGGQGTDHGGHRVGAPGGHNPAGRHRAWW